MEYDSDNDHSGAIGSSLADKKISNDGGYLRWEKKQREENFKRFPQLCSIESRCANFYKKIIHVKAELKKSRYSQEALLLYYFPELFGIKGRNPVSKMNESGIRCMYSVVLNYSKECYEDRKQWD